MTTAIKQIGTVYNCNVSVNVRSGPGKSYALVGTIAKGTEVEVISEQNGWYYVRLANGNTVYIIEKYLKVTEVTVTVTPAATASPTIAPTLSPTPSATVQPAIQVGEIYNCNVSVNMRSGPGTGYALVGTIAKGVKVDILAKQNGWYYVRLANGNTAYIIQTYVKVTQATVTAPPTSTPSATPSLTPSATIKPAKYTGTVYNCKTSVNMRSGPGTGYALVGTIAKGIQVEVLDQMNGWYYVRLANGNTAYIIEKYLSVDKTESSQSPTQSPTQSVTPTPTPDTSASTGKQQGKIANCQESVNLRSGPGTGYKLLGKINKDTVVGIISLDNGWYNIRLENGDTAYVLSTYVKLLSSEQSVSLKATINCVNAVNVRKGASSSTEKVGALKKGSTVTVLGFEAEEWYKVELEDGTVGYIFHDYILINQSAALKNANTLKVRSGPATSYSLVTTMDTSTSFSVIGLAENGWYKVKTSDGKQGWSSNSYIELK